MWWVTFLWLAHARLVAPLLHLFFIELQIHLAQFHVRCAHITVGTHAEKDIPKNETCSIREILEPFPPQGATPNCHSWICEEGSFTWKLTWWSLGGPQRSSMCCGTKVPLWCTLTDLVKVKRWKAPAIHWFIYQNYAEDFRFDCCWNRLMHVQLVKQKHILLFVTEASENCMLFKCDIATIECTSFLWSIQAFEQIWWIQSDPSKHASATLLD